MSKKISEFTLKNSLVSNDVIPILDSENNYSNKKVLVSTLPSGGAITATTPLDLTSNVLSISQASTTTDGYLTAAAYNNFSGKAVRQSVETDASTTPSIDVSLATFFNKVYRFSNALSSLTLVGAPTLADGTQSSYRYESEIQFTTGSTFTFTATGITDRWLGINSPTFEANTKYTIVFKNSYFVLGKVGA